jgi:hypothetical protein
VPEGLPAGAASTAAGARSAGAGAFGEGESPIAETEDQRADAQPQQAVPEQHPLPAERERVLVGHGPVFGHQAEGAGAEGVDEGGDGLVVEVLGEDFGDAVAGEQQQAADEAGGGAAGEHGDGEDDGAAEERVGNGEHEDALPVRRGHDGAPALGVVPGHDGGEQNAGRDAEKGDDGDGGRPEEPAEQVVALANRRGEQELVGVVGKLPAGGRVDERRSHHQRKDAHDGVEILDDEGSVAEGVFQAGAQGDLVGGGGGEHERADDEEEHPQHHAAEPEAQFEAQKSG